MADPKSTSAGGRPSLRERNRLRTRGDLLGAALKVFAESGFASATVEAIAAEAGTSKVTLYAYFPTGRDELFRELYEGVNTELLDLAAAAHATAVGLVARVDALAAPLLDIAARPLVGRLYSNSDPSVESAVAPARGHASSVYAKLLAADIDDARATGEMSAGVDSRTLAELLVGAMRAALGAVVVEPSRGAELRAGITALAAGLLAR